jgi:hypothetical protein
MAPPVARKPAFWKRYQRLWSPGQPSQKRDRPVVKRAGSTTTWSEAIWTRYRRAALAVALLVVLIGVVGVVAGVMLLASWLQPSGQLLTIEKPNGGTISAVGITCGTHGANCSTKRPKGDAIELIPEPDAGFTFVGYTGDCAPGGRTIMTTARRCGASFAPAVAVDNKGPTQPLIIAPVPTGGTLEGLDILCGTKGTACSANYPADVPAELHPTADPEYTFVKFLFDCAPIGHMQMTGPRTCSAQFSLTKEISNTVPVLPDRVARGSRGGGTASSGQPNDRGAVVSTPQQQQETSGRASPPNTQPAQTASTSSPGSNTTPTVPTPPQPPSRQSVPTTVDPKDKAPPPTPEEFAKGQIQTLLKEFCAAYEAIDPDAVQRLYPKVDMGALKKQLNRSAYKSVQCKIEKPEFLALDPSAGTAQVQSELTRVYEHVVGSEKPSEQIVTMTLSRPEARGRWVITQATYKPKPPK